MLLKACPHDDLDWKIQGEPETFEFDLGLSAPNYPIDDQLEFSARAKALKYFSESVWPSHPNSSGVLYRGSADFSRFFFWNDKQKKQFIEFSRGFNGLSELHLRRLYCVSVFIYYFQLLSHNLPDEMLLKIILNMMFLSLGVEALEPGLLRGGAVRALLPAQAMMDMCN